jgi:hypothetical protein
MYPAKDVRELTILLRISRELDVVGDVTATVDNPSELLAWALVLGGADVIAWRSEDSGHRYLQVTADRHRPPVRGRVAAVLECEQHPEFWNALGLDEVAAGQRRTLSVGDLSTAWDVMPIDHPAATSRDSAAPTAPSRTDEDQRR